MTSVSIMGGGAWGTALALTSCRAGNVTTLWVRDPQQTGQLLVSRENKKYLPGIALPAELTITSEVEQAVQSNILLFVCPVQALRSLLENIKNIVSPDVYLIVCSKGLEIETGKLPSQVVAEILPNHCVSVLSGPTFAREVASERPTAATLATEEIATARWLASSLSCTTFRLYSANDVVGVELAGALKNVIAIAAGIATARNLGESARASLITRGLAEISRLGMVLGAQGETFLGLSGVGDIILTCTSSQSRNMSFGLEVGKRERFVPDKKLPFLLTEGLFTAKAVISLAASQGIELSLFESVYRIIHQGSLIEEEIKLLLSRPLKVEPSGG